jgi:hypothetical protein
MREIEKTYKIVRIFKDSERKITITKGLTEKEAQDWCKNPETSSTTAIKPDAKFRTRKYGPWFDGYEEER